MTPPHRAAMFSESPAMVAALLNTGAELEARDKRGWTPLHLAAGFSKSSAVVMALLDAGADPKAWDEDGKTPWAHVQENDALKGTVRMNGPDVTRGRIAALEKRPFSGHPPEGPERVLGFLPPWLSGCIGPLSEACRY